MENNRPKVFTSNSMFSPGLIFQVIVSNTNRAQVAKYSEEGDVQKGQVPNENVRWRLATLTAGMSRNINSNPLIS